MKWSSALSRNSSIHSGSPFIAEISSTTSRVKPALALEDVVLVVAEAVLVLADIDLWLCSNHWFSSAAS